MPLLKTAVSGSANASVGTGASANRAAAGSLGMSAPGGWHPTVVYLLLLIVAEAIAVSFLSWHLLK